MFYILIGGSLSEGSPDRAAPMQTSAMSEVCYFKGPQNQQGRDAENIWPDWVLGSQTVTVGSHARRRAGTYRKVGTVSRKAGLYLTAALFYSYSWEVDRLGYTEEHCSGYAGCDGRKPAIVDRILQGAWHRKVVFAGVSQLPAKYALRYHRADSREDGDNSRRAGIRDKLR